MSDENNTNDINLDELSDDEIMNIDPATFGEPESGSSEEENKDEADTDDESGNADSQSADDDSDQDSSDDDTDGAGDDDESSDDDTDGADSTSDEDDDEDNASDSDTDDDNDSADDDQSEDDTDEDDSDDDDEDDDDIDFEAEYKKLMAPFRAAKREINLNGNIEDARRLLKMGVDYSKKMETLKPHLHMLRTLESANLLDPKRINFLIDLSKKDPAAIKKLLKDSDIDPMTLNLEGSEDYSPTDHTIGDAEFNVREVLDSIKDDPKFDETVDVISKQMDARSRETLQAKPEVIAEIHKHIESGVYRKVMDRVANERMLGRLSGLSDLEAYYQQGDAMFQAGEFNNPDESSSSSENSDSARQDSGSNEAQGKGPKKRKPNAKQLRNRKRAAGRTKGKAASGKVVPDFSKMTDDQIAEFDETSLN